MSAAPVDRALLDELFEAARWAPSHGATFPWRFVVFEGESRRGLLEVLWEISLDPGERRTGSDSRREKLERTVMNAPVVIGLGCASSPLPKIIEHEEIASVAMAVENMHLVATARGLGMAWSSGKKIFDARLAAFLGFEPPTRCLGLLYVGWPKGPWPTEERPAIGARVVWR